RGGDGVMLPYAPGRTAAEMTYAVLGASYGNALSSVELTLPDGLRGMAPARLASIPAGGEALVLARMGNLEASGDVVLRGKGRAHAGGGRERAPRRRGGRGGHPLGARAVGARPPRRPRARGHGCSQIRGDFAIAPLQRGEPLHLAARARKPGDALCVRTRA